MSNTPLVPQPPSEKIVIPAEDEARLSEWISFFKQLSHRVKILLPKDDEFEGFIAKAERTLRKGKNIEDNYELIGFPTEEWTAFVILINEGEPGSIFETYTWMEIFFFCFGDIAFSLNHFNWDGDAEAGNWASSYSLASYSRDCLQWDFIKKRIVDRVRNFENRVPPFK